MAKSKGDTPTSPPTIDQLKLAEAMYNIMDKMAQRADKIETAFQSQAKATAEMAENMKQMGTGEVVSQLVEVNKTLKEVAESLAKLSQTSTLVFAEISEGAEEAAVSTQQLAGDLTRTAAASGQTKKAVESLTNSLKSSIKSSKGLKEQLKAIGSYLADNFPVATGAAVGALSGLQQSFKNIVSMSSSILGFFTSIIGTMWELGKAILTLPLKILGGLIEMANTGAGGVSELAEAINGLRKEFGSLTDVTNTAIMSLSKSMGSLHAGGLSAMRMFGNLADRINLLKDLFLQGGPAIRQFTKEIEDSNGSILVYQKGLGLSNEEMGGLARSSKANGRTLKSTLNDITKQSMALGKQFGLDSKLIAKDMAKATADLAHFGHASEKQIGVAVTYAHKLGLELDKISGGLDAFANFEDAAESIANVNSVFGTNIDLMDMFNAETDADVMENWRQGLLKAGYTYDKLNFRQKNYLKQQLKVNDEQLAAGLAAGNMATNLKDISKAADKAEKETLTEAQAMTKLADAIDRVFKSGGERPKSFWEAFAMGFERTFKMIPGVQKLFQNIRGATDQFTIAGSKMAQMVYDRFPGVKKIIEALTELFDPKKFQDLLGKITGHIGKFMDDLKTGKASFKELMQHLKDEFFSFFNAEGKGGDDLLSGFGEFFDAIKVIFAGAIEWILTQMGELIKSIVEGIKNPPNVNAGGIAAGANKILSPIADAFRNGWAVLGPALGDLFDVLMEKLYNAVAPKIEKWAREHWGTIALILFGPAAAQALLGAGVGLLTKGIAKLFTSAFSSAAKDGSVQDSVKKMHQEVMGKLEKMNGGPQAAAAQPSMTDEQVKNYKKMEVSVNWSKVLQFLVGLAGVVAIGLAAYWAALKIVKGKSIQDLIAAGAVMVVVAGTAVTMAEAFKKLEAAKEIKIDEVGKFLALFAGVMLIGVAAMWAFVKMVKSYKITAADLVPIGGLILLMGVLGAVAAGVGALAVKVGELAKADPAALEIGLMTIGKISAAMIAAAAVIILALKLAKDVQPTAMEGAAKILDAIGTLAMKAGVIAGEAMIIGGIIMATAGLGEGALLIGLTAIAGIVGALAGGAVLIMKELAQLNVGNVSEFKIKVDAFVLIMGVVLDMIDSTSDILDSVYQFTGFFASTDSNTKMVKQVTRFVKTLFKGLQGLIDSMIEAAKTIPIEQVEPIEAFAKLLEALGKVISSVADSAAKFAGDTSNFWENISPLNIFGMNTHNVVKKMSAMTDFVDTLLPNLTDLVDTIINSMAGFSADPASLAAAGQAFGAIFTAVAAMMQAIMPDPSKFQKTIDSSFGPKGVAGFIMPVANIKQTQVDTQALSAGLDYVTDIITTLSDLLPDLVSSIGDELIRIVNGIDKEKIGGLSALGSLLGAVAQLATGLIPKSTEVKFPDKSNWTLVGDNVNNITVAAPDLGAMLEDLTDYLPPLIDAIIDAATGMPAGENVTAQIEQLQKVLEMLPNISSLGDTLAESMGAESGIFSSAEENTKAKRDKMILGLSSMTDFLMALIYDSAVLPALMGVLKKASGILGDTSKVAETTEKLKTLFESLSNIGSDTFSSILDFFNDLDVEVMKKLSESIGEKMPALNGLVDKFLPLGEKMAEMGESLTEMGTQLLAGAAINPDELIKNFNTVVDSVVKLFSSDLVEKASGIKDLAEHVQELIGAGVQPATTAVNDMMKAVKQIEESLNLGATFNLDAKLATFASKFGKVETKGGYKVTARDVNIYVNFKVSMDARPIEAIIVGNPSSVIKNRINLLIDATKDDSSADEAKTKLQSPTGKLPGSVI